MTDEEWLEGFKNLYSQIIDYISTFTNPKAKVDDEVSNYFQNFIIKTKEERTKESLDFKNYWKPFLNKLRKKILP